MCLLVFLDLFNPVVVLKYSEYFGIYFWFSANSLKDYAKVNINSHSVILMCFQTHFEDRAHL